MELPKIKVADFEGPFDLLLHLIKKNKISDSIYVGEILNNYCVDKNYLLREAAIRLKLELRTIS